MTAPRGRHEKRGRHERPDVRPLGYLEFPPEWSADQILDFRRRWLEERARLSKASPLERLFPFRPGRFG